jgi:hypothetical protein
MNGSNCEKIRLMFVGVVVAIALGGGSANADFIFGAPVHLGPPISSPNEEGVNCITADGLEMYLECYGRGGYGIWDILVSRRATVNDDWGEPENLGATINTGQSDVHPSLSVDGLEMYFTSFDRPGGYGNGDTWVARRPTRNDPWGPPENLGPVVNSSVWDHAPRISADGLELYFSSTRAGGYGAEDLWVARRATKNDPWQAPVNLGSLVNTPASEDFPTLSPDGLLLAFSEYPSRPLRPGGYGGQDIWLARRASPSYPWGTPVNLGPIVNTSGLDIAATFSPDGLTLYVMSTRPGGLGGTFGDIYQAPILPIVDFNGDGKVAIEDLTLLIDNWGQSEPLCDIGPVPWGDGIVDRQDLEVLMSRWGQEMQDGTLLAHWKLDEVEGMIAFDSAGSHDGTVLGPPAWQPAGGAVDGALEFNGMTFVVADNVLNPADGPFSAFAWVKGGIPGQVILSQQAGANWLMSDPATGAFRTELKSGGRLSSTLCSDTAITDGDWHRVGLVSDGSNRILYVDDAADARDTETGLAGTYGDLQIGAGKNLAPGTFFTGLIDEVRIYNRAVQP